MFENIGKKIKTLAEVVCTILIVLSLLGGFICGIALDNITFLFIGIISAFASWISGFCLYGFGELIEQTTRIADAVCGNETIYEETTDDTDYETEDEDKDQDQDQDQIMPQCSICGKKTENLAQIESNGDIIWVCKKCAIKSIKSSNI
jgi:hypothetical protein